MKKEISFEMKVERAIRGIRNDVYCYNAADIIKVFGKRVMNNRDVCLALVKYRRDGYESLDIKHQQDIEIAKQAVSSYCYNYELIPSSLEGNAELAKISLKRGLPFYKLSCSARNNREVALYAVSINEYYFEELSEELRNDEDIAFAALEKSINNLKYIGSDVRNSKRIFDYVISNNKLLYTDAMGCELRKDKEYVLHVIKDYLQNCSLRFFCKQLHEDLLSDREVAIASVSVDGMAIVHFSDQIRNDDEVVSIALKNDGESIKFVNERFTKDKNYALIALKTYPAAILYLDRSIQYDPEIVKYVLDNHFEESIKNPDFQQFYKNYMLVLTQYLFDAQNKTGSLMTDVTELDGYNNEETNVGSSRVRGSKEERV